MAIEVAVFGEPLLAIYPSDHCRIRDGVSLLTNWSGDTSNVVLALRKLGHQSVYLTGVGADVLGQSFLTLWQNAGLDISQVTTDAQHKTGLCFISYERQSHEFTYYRKNSAASMLTSEDIDWEIVREAKVLHLSSISQSMSRNALDLSFELLAFAKQHGISVSYDVNYRPRLWKKDLAKAVIAYTIREYTNILEITNDEMALLNWGETPEAFIRYFPTLPDIWAIKMGAQGCYLHHMGKGAFVPPCAVKIGDTVGAGDAFDAGLITGILEGLPIQELGTFANAVAAMTCQGMGPVATQPTRAEVEQFLQTAQTKTHRELFS